MTDYGISYIGDAPLNVTSANITLTPAEYSALQQVIFNNSLLFGKICLAVGFVLGLVVMYFYMKERQSRKARAEYEAFIKAEEERKHDSISP